MKRLFLMFACFCVSMFVVIAQNRQVTGTVSDGDDNPVIGASVVVKGNPSIGTTTNIEGKFTLSVPASATHLVIKYLGFSDAEVAVAENVKVVLQQSAEALDEVIVVAYGTAKKSSFTGSATVIKSDEISKVQTTNVTNALVGKVTGMQMTSGTGQPGQTNPGMRVRGITSITAGSDPLIILDGVPYSGDLNNLNSLDVESMTVLKDAASASLYGARGANGVILITTKKGAKGEARVEVDVKWGQNSRSTQDYNFVQSPAQYYEMYYGALKSYFGASTEDNGLGYSAQQAHILANQNMIAQNDYGLSFNVYNVPSGQFLIGNNGKLNPAATLGRTVTYRGQDYYLIPDRWLDYAYKTSDRKEYNVSVSTGNDKSSFYASAGYLDNTGITSNSDYKRFVGRLKADYQVKPWLKIDANMSYAHYNANQLGEDGVSNSSGNVFAISTQIAPIYPLFIRDGAGNIMQDANGITMYDYADNKNAGLTRPIFSGTNAIADAILNSYYNDGNAFTAGGMAEIRLLKNFKFSSTNAVVVDETRVTDITNPFYGQYAPSNGIVYKQHARSFAYNFQQLLSWAQDFDKHHPSVLLGHESYWNKYYTMSAQKSNMFDPNNHEMNGAITDGSPGSYTTSYDTEGYFFRGQYDYDNKYFGSASFRRDATSRFHPDNRWGNFWSFGGAWILSKESFLENVEQIDMLKYKLSYGERGNDNIGNYLYTNTYSIVNSSGRPAATPNSTRGNKDVTWETVGDLNTGFEFDLFNNRLSGSLEYYYRKTTDMLFAFAIPPALGYTQYYANIGDMRNTGVEAELKGMVVKTNNITWDLSLNLTHNDNKIIYLPEERKTTTTSEGVQGYASGNQFIGEGIPLYTFYMAKYAGVSENGESQWWKDVLDDRGDVIGQEKTTSFSDHTSYLCGTALPDWFGGFGTQLTIYGFDVSASFAYQIGGLVYDGDYASAMASPIATSKGHAFHADLLDAWTPENTSSNIPRFRFGDQYSASTSDRFLTDASYLSLNNINAGYMIPSRICKKLGIERVRIYLAADNVYMWSKRQGLAPNYNFSGGANSTIYAPIRTISGGLNISF